MRALKHFQTCNSNIIEKGIKDILKANSMYTISDAMGIIEYANEKFVKFQPSTLIVCVNG